MVNGETHRTQFNSPYRPPGYAPENATAAYDLSARYLRQALERNERPIVDAILGNGRISVRRSENRGVRQGQSVLFAEPHHFSQSRRLPEYGW
ncbi:hypothetical protein ACVIDN_005468 [Rhizobium brockwellii]|jgi:hypothetical protein